MHANWTTVTFIISSMLTVTTPLVQVVFARWYNASSPKAIPNSQIKAVARRTRASEFLSTWSMPIVLVVVNVLGLVSDFRTIRPPLLVRDVFFVAVHVSGLLMAMFIGLFVLALNLIGRMLDVQGRLADSHSGALEMIGFIGSEVGKKADSRRRKD